MDRRGWTLAAAALGAALAGGIAWLARSRPDAPTPVEPAADATEAPSRRAGASDPRATPAAGAIDPPPPTVTEGSDAARRVAADVRGIAGVVTFPGGERVLGATTVLVLREPDPDDRRVEPERVAEQRVVGGERFAFGDLPDGPLRVVALHRPTRTTHERVATPGQRAPAAWGPRDELAAPLWVAEAREVRADGAELALELAPPPLVLGRVLGADGAPCAEYRFEIRRLAGELWTVREHRLRRAVSPMGPAERMPRFANPDGGFALEHLFPGRWSLRVVPRDRALRPTVEEIEVPVAGDVTIVCPRAVAVEGVVVDPDGEPVAGATVECFWGAAGRREAGGRLVPQLSVRSGADGRYRLWPVEADCRVRARSPGRAPSELVGCAAPPGTETVTRTLRLRRPARIVGTLRGATDLVAGRTVAAVDAESGVVVGLAGREPAGRFELADLAPGTWRVLVLPEPDGRRLLSGDAGGRALRALAAAGAAELRAAGALVEVDLAEGAAAAVELALPDG